MACSVGLTMIVSVAPVLAANKSGVEPQVISLPKGPGSIEGLGESFEPQLNTGTATYAVKIRVSPGVDKHQPEVVLEYNSGYGNSPVGMGWNLNTDFIQRQTEKGLPSYTESDTYIYGRAGELVPLGGSTFRLKIEGLFMKFQKTAEGWEAWQKNGTHLYFGSTADARLENARGTFQWLLERSVDTNGNEIRYFYESDGGQRYPSEIRYSVSDAAYKSVQFFYGQRPDPFTDYHSRSRVTTSKRLTRIDVRSGDRLVRRYGLRYKEGSIFSLLAAVTQYGTDGVTALPPVTFDYSGYAPGEIKTVAMTNPPPVGISLANGNVDLVDINGDSLPDLIQTSPADGTHYFYINRGKGVWDAAVSTPTASPQHLLSSDGVLMSDMDGDGLVDLFVKNNDLFGYFRNRGVLGWEETDWIPCSPNPGFSFENPNIRLLDVNNDKLIDVVFDNGSSYYVWLNRKSNQWSDAFDYETHLPDGSHLSFTSNAVKLGDVNGDRMEDVLYVIDGHVSYFPSMGNGEFDAEVVMASPPAGLGILAEKLTTADINNDGLTDLVLVSNSSITVWFNGGNNAFKPPVTFEDTPAFVDGQSSYRFADMNGDGFRDLLIIDDQNADPYQCVDFNSGVHPNLLTKIDNGLGMETTIAYRSSTDFYVSDRDAGRPWSTKLPFPVQVVSQVTVKDRNSGQEYVADYRYRDGYYDGAEKEFRGFGEVLKYNRGDDDAPTLQTRYAFDVGKEEESLKGMVRSVAALEENGTIDPPSGLFDRVEHVLTTRELLDGTNGEKVAFSFISGKKTFLYENTVQPLTLSQEFDQDNYGNVVLDHQYGLVDGALLAAGNDEVLTTTEYLIDETRWIVDRPLVVRKTDLAGGFVSLQRNGYDERGNLIRQEQSPDGVNLIALAQNLFDGYGNIVQITDANGHWRTIAYDESFHTFPVSETIGGLGLAVSADYDAGLGVPTRFTDFNGNATFFGYDALGRLTAIAKPGDSLALPTQEFVYTLAAPVSSVLTRSREISGLSGTYDAVTYYDGLGRKLQTRSEGADGSWMVSEAAVHNQQKGVRSKWLPFYAGSSAYGAPPEANAHVSFRYDATGRSVRETNPDASFRSTMYGPLSITSSDEIDNAGSGTPHTTVNDGLGRIREVRERNGSETYVTRYGYDGLNNLTRVADNEGNVKTMAFDGLGRKIRMDDPDKHEMRYEYDPAGNLVWTKDAKAQEVTYTYDAANRVVTESANGLKVRYHYDGDLPAGYSTLRNTLGRLAYVEDEAGMECLSYDERGNRTVRVRTAGGRAFINRMAYDAMDRVVAFTYPDGFTLNYQYNSMNQLAAVPGFVAGISYTAAGQKESFAYANGIQSLYSYDSRQRLDRLQTRTGARVFQDLTYTYDVVSNIIAIADGRPEKTTEDRGRVFQYDDLYRLNEATAPAWQESYRYSSIGNMTSKTGLGNMTYGASGAGPHALTGAEGAGLSYTYDANGNISSKEPGFTYRFDHRDRLVGAKRQSDDADIAYTYDYAGNRTVKTVTVGNASSQAVYADRFTELRGDLLTKQIFAGDRLIARIVSPFSADVLQTRTTPLTIEDFDRSPKDGVITLAEIKAQGTDATRLESAEVADALRIYHENRESRPGLLPFGTVARAVHELGQAASASQAVTYFYVPDHLGSASIVTDSQGSPVEESVFYPYGADRARTGGYRSEYRFTGKELDDETGLHYFGARYYDSQTGRFVSVDPLYVEDVNDLISVPQGLNFYTYTSNNPVRHVDPSGLMKVDVVSWLKTITNSILGFFVPDNQRATATSDAGSSAVSNDLSVTSATPKYRYQNAAYDIGQTVGGGECTDYAKAITTLDSKPFQGPLGYSDCTTCKGPNMESTLAGAVRQNKAFYRGKETIQIGNILVLDALPYDKKRTANHVAVVTDINQSNGYLVIREQNIKHNPNGTTFVSQTEIAPDSDEIFGAYKTKLLEDNQK